MDRPSQDLELYTIPSCSSWFSWNNIHEVERFSLREFFDSTSVTRSPRIYKDYRDFIISKYREDPSRKLTFTEVRKSLVGDISVLHKVFTFLEKWGLINFNLGEGNGKNGYGESATKVEDEEEHWKGRVKVEEGAPYGVRVVGAPNSVKPLIAPPLPPSLAVDGGSVVGEVGESGFKWPPLASYSDIYGDLMQEELVKKGLVCGSCRENCDSLHYEYSKDGSFILCEKCFKGENYENKSADDFQLKENLKQETTWTESETLLLLESVLKHGDDWDLVAKTVQTKSKQECISKLIQLPFGDLMLGSANKKGGYLDVITDIVNSKQMGLSCSDPQEPAKVEDQEPGLKNKEDAPEVKPKEQEPDLKAEEQERELQAEEQEPELQAKEQEPELQAKEQSPELKENEQENGDAEDEGPPLKRMCIEPALDTGNLLMKQVARIATMLGPHVTASAADAAVTALCYENQCSREIFDDDDDDNYADLNPSETCDERRAAEGDGSMEDKRPNESEIQGKPSVKSITPLNLRTRAATATALSAAAASAKLLADQEERKIGHLVATIVETQLEKLKRKMKYIEDLEVIMVKEQAQLEELEESLVSDRINVLQRIFTANINKSKEYTSVKESD